MTPAARVEAWNRRYKDGDLMICNGEYVRIRDWAFTDAEDSVMILIEKPCGCKHIFPIDELEPTSETKVKAWNREHPVGTPVLYQGRETNVTTKAWVDYHGDALVFIGASEIVNLDDVEPV